MLPRTELPFLPADLSGSDPCLLISPVSPAVVSPVGSSVGSAVDFARKDFTESIIRLTYC